MAAEENAALAATELFGYAASSTSASWPIPARTDERATQVDLDGERLSELELEPVLQAAGRGRGPDHPEPDVGCHGGVLAVPRPVGEVASQDRSLLPSAVEEMLRFVTPVMNFRRQATEDVEIGGQLIKAGDKVVFFHVSANRDETVFEDPDRFDVGRKPNPHMAFGGGGPHFCLGANLARMEIMVMFEHLLDRLPDIRVVGEVERLQSNFINGVKHLPVAFSPTGLVAVA